MAAAFLCGAGVACVATLRMVAGEPYFDPGAGRMIRRAILLAGAAALAPVLAGAALAEPGNEGQLAFAPPENPQVLTRTVRRSLPGGREIMVRRHYRISFMREGIGYRVDGELISTEVDAPPAVRAFAELERNRPESGVFPILLDASGRIVNRSQSRSDTSATQSANLAVARITGAGLSSTEQTQASDFVRQIERQGVSNPWPLDLFNPLPGTRTEVRKVTIPQGGEGEISVSIDAPADSAQNYLTSIERVVVTRLAGTERLSRERWTMEPF